MTESNDNSDDDAAAAAAAAAAADVPRYHHGHELMRSRQFTVNLLDEMRIQPVSPRQCRPSTISADAVYQQQSCCC